MFSKEIVWENKEKFGCEYLKLTIKNTAILIESTVIYLEDDSPIQIDYWVELDRSWKTKKVSIKVRGGESLHLISNDKGEWFDQHGDRKDELKGVIDIDISATPFSNSLPINRFDWKPSQKRQFEMIYISVPELKIERIEQTYTYVEGKKKTRTFNYQCRDFESLISVDEKGFVIDYPQVFTRRY